MNKEEILNYLKDSYYSNKRIPRSKDKSNPFSGKKVLKLFGSWNNALTIAGIPCNKYPKTDIPCKQCKKIFKKFNNEVKKYTNHYCSRTCAAVYNNRHKNFGIKISKLENFLQKNLKGFDFKYNDRDVCDGLELDIYIPDLKLAIEINGIFHYKPIFGNEKLNKTIIKDKMKKDLCKLKGISFYIIKDTSHNFSEKYGYVILNDIYCIIYKEIFKKVVYEINSYKIENKIV
jgi:hypothetical protein